MPDLTPVSMAACTRAIGLEQMVVGSTGNEYTVTCLDRWEWACTCPAFHFKFQKEGDWCKHIELVRDKICHWNELLDGGTTDEAGRCPECGHDCEFFTVMV